MPENCSTWSGVPENAVAFATAEKHPKDLSASLYGLGLRVQDSGLKYTFFPSGMESAFSSSIEFPGALFYTSYPYTRAHRKCEWYLSRLLHYIFRALRSVAKPKKLNVTLAKKLNSCSHMIPRVPNPPIASRV